MTNLEANSTGLEEILAMVNALPEAGSGGGEGADSEMLVSLIERSIRELSISSVTLIGSYAFASYESLTTANFPLCTRIGAGAFSSCISLTTISFPACTRIDSNAFRSCVFLTTISFPACTHIGSNAFNTCYRLTTANFPLCEQIGSNAFYSCTSLATANFPLCERIDSRAFEGCLVLSALILGASSVCSLRNSNAFSRASMINAGTGYIYVPSSLVASYKAATNWAYYSNQISAIEDSPYA